MFVLTIDQQGSTGHRDLVPELLAALTAHLGAAQPVLPFDRTVGDEIQGVLDDPAVVLDLILFVLRRRGWSVGLGIGAVDHPMPAESRAAAGAAFVCARAAVERAKLKGAVVPLAVEGPDPVAAGEIEALLRLIATLRDRRSARGWEVIDALATTGGRRKEVAAQLGISEQAVSQRLRAGLWAEEMAVHPVIIRLLGEGNR